MQKSLNKTSSRKQKRLGEHLIDRDLIQHRDLEQALAYQSRYGIRLGESLIHLRILGESEVFKALAEARGIPFVDLTSLKQGDIESKVLQHISLSLAQKEHLIPIAIKEVQSRFRLFVATSEPFNFRIFQELEFKIGLPISVLLTTPKSIRHSLRTFYGSQANLVEGETFEEWMDLFEMQKMHVLDEESLNLSLVDRPHKNNRS